MNLIKRFSLLCLAALFFFGIVFGWVITDSLEKNMLLRAKYLTAKLVSEEVKREFLPSELAIPKTGKDYEDFAKKISHLILGTNIERVKIWNKHMVVIWSDNKKLVGKRFIDDEDLNKALKGEIISQIMVPDKPENRYEDPNKKLLEIYVPVVFEETKEIEVVFEIYQNLTALYEDIQYQKKITWTSIITGFIILYLLLFGIVWGASRHIESQTSEIKESEERYRSLLSSAKDGIISVDKSGKIILYNDAAKQIFGYSADEIIGKSVTILIPERYINLHENGILSFFGTGTKNIIGRSVEFEGLRKNGETFPMELSLSVSGRNQSPIVTAILRDISERKSMQDTLINAEKHTMVSIIAGSIGHELNNAITVLMGYTRRLMQKPDDLNLVNKCSEIFSTQSQRLNLYANNLLELSKPREPQKRSFDLNALLDQVTDFLFISGILKRYIIIKEYMPDLALVIGDEMLIEQAISNLEINASQAMEDHGTLSLRTRFSQDNLYVEFLISDTGYGIPAEKLNQIFLPFYTTKEKGTGLGMYIVKQIIDQHNGYIEVESKEGFGTTITVGLPVVKGGYKT